SLSYRSVHRIREDLQAAGIEDVECRVSGSPSGDPSAQAESLPEGESRTPNTENRTPNTQQPTAKLIGQLETIIQLCEQLDGYPRHLSLHNGGMLITREPLVDIVPIEYATSGVRVCQFNKDDVEALGLIKFDILGLRTLSIVDEAVVMIKE